MLLAWKAGYEAGYDYGWCEGNDGNPHDEEFHVAKSSGTQIMAVNDCQRIIDG